MARMGRPIGQNGHRKFHSNPIHKWRVANGITASEAARRIGYSRSGYEKAIRYRALPDQERTRRIAKILGWSRGQVLEHWMENYEATA
jgi:transcriptional regulator with XRE-family HTH domain